MLKISGFLGKNIFLLILLIFALLLFLFDIFGLDKTLRSFFPPASFYDVPFKDSTGNFLTFLAVLIAYFTLSQLRKQLTIEQEPYVVISDGIKLGGIDNNAIQNKDREYLELRVKNVGRGPAIRVTVNSNSKNSDKAFFRSDQTHSVDLTSGENKSKWVVDEGNFRKILNIKGTDASKMKKIITLFIHYFNQLGETQITKVNLYYDGQKSFLKVLENKKLK